MLLSGGSESVMGTGVGSTLTVRRSVRVRCCVSSDWIACVTEKQLGTESEEGGGPCEASRARTCAEAKENETTRPMSYAIRRRFCEMRSQKDNGGRRDNGSAMDECGVGGDSNISKTYCESSLRIVSKVVRIAVFVR